MPVKVGAGGVDHVGVDPVRLGHVTNQLMRELFMGADSVKGNGHIPVRFGLLEGWTW